MDGGGAIVTISSTIAKTGTHSLAVTGRTTTTVGPTYAMPLGAAEYNVVFNALHTGANPHDLVLQATYTCLGGSPAVAPATTTVTQCRCQRLDPDRGHDCLAAAGRSRGLPAHRRRDLRAASGGRIVWRRDRVSGSLRR